MPEHPTIGYLGADVLGDAELRHEAGGLIAAEVPLEVVSAHCLAPPSFRDDRESEEVANGIEHLYPLGISRSTREAIAASSVFGKRFWKLIHQIGFRRGDENRRGLRWLFRLPGALRLAMLWRDKRVGHIHAHGPAEIAEIAMHAAKLLEIGFSFTERTGYAFDNRYAKYAVEREGVLSLARGARFIVCGSEYKRRQYLEMGIAPQRLPVVYQGIDVRRCGPSIDSVFNGGETSGNAPSSPSVILTAGCLREESGFHDLITAFALLRDRGARFQCVVTGSGPRESKLRKQTLRLELQDRVTVTGMSVLAQGLPRLLAGATMLVQPYLERQSAGLAELPQVLLESMLRGVPVISTRSAGIPDLVRDRQTGLLVEPHNVSALADAIGELLSDKELRSRLAAEAKPWTAANFNRELAIDRLEELFITAAWTPGNSPPRTYMNSAPNALSQYGKAFQPTEKERLPQEMAMLEPR